ncbi:MULTISPECIES: GntR family transcriptional regulator [Capnocytophaga]|uniref:Uncharacterized HTH-type transcriptional regulator yhcF n=1 Tax=Capnocytophaga canis TaxID=1848903 RepID=A0A0B7IUB2_9FLAO|nr:MULTISPECIES: GntR family transcriptional regulator [Capnocytophaga]ATA73227.1 GntR family transcriptional regulator [Capnocytophaga sp. H4358]ATA75365.1 GntR family transcriptional regulator [Capnocytophaga sp. H2931]CEN45939.1 Uncharacterized HTH-type transcriptional regulator yhcF [Capnocytophaga canis]CEN53672.1 Uncharacterized HTH-type transcriptional regulator yhcF [Capnocytophaga canis]GIM61527.1 GntR family transcriptional regulator [Capnocytophaga canis]
MEIRDTGRAIYLQIAEFVCKKILLDEWLPETKIPSVRELAVQLTVNPNTVARSYEVLKTNGIIIDKRGIGYFVEKEGKQQAKNFRQADFLENELPTFFNTLHTLGIELNDLEPKFQVFKQQLKAKQDENQ